MPNSRDAFEDAAAALSQLRTLGVSIDRVIREVGGSSAAVSKAATMFAESKDELGAIRQAIDESSRRIREIEEALSIERRTHMATIAGEVRTTIEAVAALAKRVELAHAKLYTHVERMTTEAAMAVARESRRTRQAMWFTLAALLVSQIVVGVLLAVTF